MSIADVREYVEKAVETDYVMPLYMPFLPAILTLAGFLVMILSTYFAGWYYHYEVRLYIGPPSFHFLAVGLGLLLIFLGGVVNIYVVYKWVKRRNDHFARAIALFDRVKESLAGSLRGPELETSLSHVDRLIKDYQLEFERRNPVLWALLQLVPYVGTIILFYVYHFLNKDFWRHFLWEKRVLDSLNEVLARAGVGMRIRFRDEYAFPNRNTVLYIILAVLTVGVFALYWVYTLAKDPNDHFLEHRRVEERLMEALGKISPA